MSQATTVLRELQYCSGWFVADFLPSNEIMRFDPFSAFSARDRFPVRISSPLIPNPFRMHPTLSGPAVRSVPISKGHCPGLSMLSPFRQASLFSRFLERTAGQLGALCRSCRYAPIRSFRSLYAPVSCFFFHDLHWPFVKLALLFPMPILIFWLLPFGVMKWVVGRQGRSML